MKYTYTVRRSGRKTLALEITRDLQVLVRAPRDCSGLLIEKMVSEHENWIGASLEKMKHIRAADIEPTAAERAALIEKAKLEIPERVAYFASIMGLEPSGLKITGAKKRFGSCSGKNSLCFSWRLMRFPREAVDYVVVHELAHIRHKNHGREFYALIKKILTDYMERRNLLRS